ncbi:hypothetical protein F5146DRAFT_1030949, partial [Armillaria mellea]
MASGSATSVAMLQLYSLHFGVLISTLGMRNQCRDIVGNVDTGRQYSGSSYRVLLRSSFSRPRFSLECLFLASCIASIDQCGVDCSISTLHPCPEL